MNYSARYVGLPLQGRPFPVCMPLPLLDPAVSEAENNIRAPRPLIFFGALTSIAVASQGLIDVCKPNGQHVPTSLMLLSIANSGERKSTAANVFFRPIRAFQEQHHLSYQQELNHQRVKHTIWETKKNALLKAIATKTKQGLSAEHEESALVEHGSCKPAPIRAFKMLYEDSTPEALFSGLHQHLPTAGLVSDEGGAILNGKALNDLPKHNAMWSGDSITVDRSSGPSYQISDARLSVSIMAQDNAFQEYMERRGDKSRGYGLWARFLVCQPYSTQGTRFISNGTMSWEHCDKFAMRLSEILEKNKSLLDGSHSQRSVIVFSPLASDRWLDIYNSIESEIRQGGRFFGAGDHASKLADNIARVAALLHYFEEGGGEIPLDTLECAISFCCWCSDEFLRLFMPPPVEQQDAFELNGWFDTFRNKNERYIRKNYVRQYCLNKLREKNRLNRALELLRLQGAISFFYRGKTLYLDLTPNVPSFQTALL